MKHEKSTIERFLSSSSNVRLEGPEKSERVFFFPSEKKKPRMEKIPESYKSNFS